MPNEFQDRAAFDSAERDYLEPPREPQVIGTCYICGWPVYSTSWYDYTVNGICHSDCEAKEGKYGV